MCSVRPRHFLTEDEKAELRECTAVALDIGSSTMRCGHIEWRHGDDRDDDDDDDDAPTEGGWRGLEAPAMVTPSVAYRPYQIERGATRRGVIRGRPCWDVWPDVLYIAAWGDDSLRVSFNENVLVLTVSPLCDARDLENTVQHIFEGCNPPVAFVGVDAEFCARAARAPGAALVVQCGAELTSVCPVLWGSLDTGAVTTVRFGGKDVAELALPLVTRAGRRATGGARIDELPLLAKKLLEENTGTLWPPPPARKRGSSCSNGSSNSSNDGGGGKGITKGGSSGAAAAAGGGRDADGDEEPGEGEPVTRVWNTLQERIMPNECKDGIALTFSAAERADLMEPWFAGLLPPEEEEEEGGEAAGAAVAAAAPGGEDGAFYGLVDMIERSLAASDPDVRGELLSNIVLAGGPTTHPHFERRLLHELRERQGYDNACVLNSAEGQPEPSHTRTSRACLAWQGAASMVEEPQLIYDVFGTKEDYDENGPALARLKFCGGVPPRPLARGKLTKAARAGVKRA